MVVPSDVEAKIRYLINKFPTTEWSGVLFYRYEGSFEKDNLVITCKDIFPMDLGTSGWTEFKMSEEVTAYIAENIELFDCEMGLVHSHHRLGAFFSSQDIDTLRSEGADTNCFVSLIVDTRGTYQAAITRRVTQSSSVIIQDAKECYEFFGNGEVCHSTGSSPITKTVSKEIIEYFMLDVERKTVDNPLGYLDERFDEIEKRKKESGSSSFDNVTLRNSQGMTFDGWRQKKESPRQLSLFGSDYDKDKEKAAIQPLSTDWTPNPKVIDLLVRQLVTGCLFINPNLDLNQWINNTMDAKYELVFGDNESDFEHWAEFYTEFIVHRYKNEISAENMDYYNSQILLAKVADALYDRLSEYAGANYYIDAYLQTLEIYC